MNTCRYYNSWIETSEETAESDTSTSVPDTSSSRNPNTNTTNADKSSSSRITPAASLRMRNSLGLRDDLEKFAPAEVY